MAAARSSASMKSPAWRAISSACRRSSSSSRPWSVRMAGSAATSAPPASGRSSWTGCACAGSRCRTTCSIRKRNTSKPNMDALYFLFVILVFLAVAGFIEGAFLTWNAYRGPEARRIERRLQAMSGGGAKVGAPLLRKRLLSEVPAFERLLLVVPRLHLLDRLLVQSGAGMNLANLLGLAAALAVLAAAGGDFLRFPAWIVAVAAAFSALLPFAYLLRLRQQRMNAIDEQLPHTLYL